MACIVSGHKIQGKSTRVLYTIMNAWRKSAHKQYETHFNKWRTYYNDMNIELFNGNIKLALEFLQDMVDIKYSYSAINST